MNEMNELLLLLLLLLPVLGNFSFRFSKPPIRWLHERRNFSHFHLAPSRTELKWWKAKQVHWHSNFPFAG